MFGIITLFTGVDFGKAYDISSHLRDSIFFPAVCLKNAEMKFNFGDTPFAYPPQVSIQSRKLLTDRIVLL